MNEHPGLGEWVAGKKFMVVEDVDTSRMLVSGLLRSLGASSVVTAVNGEDALEKIEKKGVPDIIICDWVMPGMDGLALLGVVKQLHDHVRFVMLTAQTDAEHVRQAAYLKVDGYVAKPFSRQTLVECLGKLMQKG
ncbi:response regulator [Magnetospirillum aberrantis]|uniref:Response regulator n=1 Tax=Magnetospirillum aberrantis SpK TaxID=908842 RepID=A0A7C9V1R5_9PROT|nr:response regulator [Magnetospirillum aberrantis]NFV82234.1 response regulator [Magnetospirillum aberrantis SpK]